MGPILLKKITDELNESLRAGVVSKVRQPKKDIVILEIFIRGRIYKLLISTNPLEPRMHLTEKKYPNPVRPLRFCAYLRSAITNAVIEKIGVKTSERIAEIELRKKTEDGSTRSLFLIVELTGKSSNIILIDDKVSVLDALKYFLPESSIRAVGPGIKLEPLPVHETKEENGIEKSAATWNESADAHYNKIFVDSETKKLTNELRRKVKREEKKLRRKIRNLESDITKAEENIQNSNVAELLVANFKMLKRGMKEIELEDYRESPPKKTTIKLDERLGPEDNIDKFYKLAKKGKKTVKLTGERLPKVLNDLNYIHVLGFSIDEAKDIEGLELITDEMEEAGLLKKKREEKKSSKKREKKSEPIEKIETEKGAVILIGKSGLGNDLIIKKYAKAGDLWFHAKGSPGAHVLLKEKDANEANIAQAARLAALRSKAGKDKKVEVIMATGSNIKKPKGAKPGMVRVAKFKSILVNTTP
ncbi:MAG: NFACT RNA binding domain-containing protein [Thermodesulfobacteriota bacterium]